MPLSLETPLGEALLKSCTHEVPPVRHVSTQLPALAGQSVHMKGWVHRLRDFVEHGYDVRRLIRTIAVSKVYGLSSQPNADNLRD